MSKIKSDFIRKWSSWFAIHTDNTLLEAFERELNEVIESELQNPSSLPLFHRDNPLVDEMKNTLSNKQKVMTEDFELEYVKNTIKNLK